MSREGLREQAREIGPEAGTRLWHPFADMAAVRGAELVLERGRDVWVWDVDGRRYLDATASLWYANIGHAHPRLAAAAAEQMGRLEAYSIFGDLATPPALELAERLAELAPMTGARTFLTSGGGDSIDTAAKLARRYWLECGEPERTRLVVREHAYHGTHGFGTGLAGIPANRAAWGPLDPEVSIVPYDSVDAMRAELDDVGPDRVAAVFVEPVIGAGGVRVPPDGYIEGVAELCRDTGVLLIIDSVICGFGRLGTWFGIERWDVEPDLITFAKGVTSGYLPLGGVLASERVADPFWSEPGRATFRHGQTYAGHATCCAVALANIDVLSEGLLERGRELEGDLAAALATVADHPAVGEVRGGIGLAGAVGLRPEILAEDAGAPAKVALAGRERGVLVRPVGDGVAVSPPLTIETGQLSEIAGAIAAGLDVVAESPALR